MKRFFAKYGLLFPGMGIYLVFKIIPMLQSLYVSLFSWDGLSPKKTFVGFSNYVSFFSDPVSLLALANTFRWMVFSLTLPLGLGFFLAVSLDRKMAGKTVFRSIFYIPTVLPLITLGVIWGWIFNPSYGALNVFLRSMGLSSVARSWLALPETATWALMVPALWRNCGLPMVLFLAGLQNIPDELYEAATIDGARGIHRFFHITIPGLVETFIIVTSLLVVDSLRLFDLIYVMTWGGPGRSTQVLATWMYFNTFAYYKAGYGSAISWILTVLSVVIIYPYIKIMSEK